MMKKKKVTQAEILTSCLAQIQVSGYFLRYLDVFEKFRKLEEINEKIVDF